MPTAHMDLRMEGRMSQPEFDERMDAAIARAAYELGSGSWAGVIIGAFMNPVDDRDRLGQEMSDA